MGNRGIKVVVELGQEICPCRVRCLAFKNVWVALGKDCAQHADHRWWLQINGLVEHVAWVTPSDAQYVVNGKLRIGYHFKIVNVWQQATLAEEVVVASAGGSIVAGTCGLGILMTPNGSISATIDSGLLFQD